MPTPRLQVLVLLALAAATPIAHAQPADVPNAISAPQPDPEQNGEPRQLPLLPITLDDWLKANGGLSRLKFKLDNATTFEIADEVKEQTGIELWPGDNMRNGGETQRFSVEATGQTFWEAVAQWNKNAKPDAPRLNLQRDWNNRDRWSMVKWNNMSPGRNLQLGPALMIANSISASHSRTQSLLPEDDPKANAKAKAPEESDSMSLRAGMRIDPKLSPLILGLIPQIDSITDDKGRAIELNNNYQDPWRDDNNDDMYWSLKSPARDARRIASFKGILRLAVLTKREHWEIDLEDPNEAKAEKSFKSAEAEVKVRLEGMTRRLSSWNISLHLERRDIGPVRSFKPNGRDNYNEARLGDTNDTARAIRVLNSKGEPLGSSGADSNQSEENGVRILKTEISIQDSYDDDKKPEEMRPAKIIIDVPMEWREIQIPFELTDLPLP